MQSRRQPRLHTALSFTLSLSLSLSGTKVLKMATQRIARIETTGGGFHFTFFLLGLLFVKVLMSIRKKRKKKRFPLLSEKGITVNKKRKMKSPTGRFNSGNSLGARERESKAQSSMQPRLPPRLHTALRLTISLSLSLAPQC